MAYRDNAHGVELRCKELLGEIEIVEQRTREYPYLKWKKENLEHDLAVLTNKPPKVRTSLERVLLHLGIAIVALVLVSLCALRAIGPQVNTAGTPYIDRLE